MVKNLKNQTSQVISSPWWWGGISLLLAGIFLWWLASAILPVALVEARYQYHQALSSLFHVDDIRQLLLPNFSGALDLRGRSRHMEYGITIPRLRLDEPVVFNVDPNDKAAYTAALKKGIAHASGTAFPDNPGLGYYFAHSSHPDFRSQFNAIFYLLGKLQPDDEVFIWHEGQQFEYRVTHTQETSPDDVSFLNQDIGGEQIVLQTCWPPGTTQRRLLVFAERVEK